MGIIKRNDVSFSMIITFVMILMFSSLKSTSGDCFDDCIRKCPPEDYQCYDRCGWSCGPPQMISTSHYCNLGCSIRHCAKLYKGKVLKFSYFFD